MLNVAQISIKIVALSFLVLGAFGIPIKGVTLVVTKTADTNDGACDSDCSLREAIVASNMSPTADIINFDPIVFGSSQVITLGGSELSIETDSVLTINGPGQNLLTISGNNLSRVLYVGNNVTLDLNGIAITGGNGVGAAAHGGAVLVNGFSTVDFANVMISGNRTTGQGGGISVVLSTLSMTDSVVSSNRAQSSAGGIKANDSVVTLIGSAVTGNPEGGGIQLGSGSTLYVLASVISDNSFGGDGGGIDNDGGVVTIEDSIISGNYSAQGGGGISGTNGSITIINSSIDGNSTGFFGGGGIQSYGKLTILDSTVANNLVVIGDGGAIRSRAQGSTLDIRNSTILGNMTTGAGGGIYDGGSGLNNAPSLVIRDSLIADNSANDKGGGITGGGYSLFYNVTFFGNSSLTNGGAIAWVGGSSLLQTIITNCTVIGNVAADGGGVYNSNFFYTRNSIVANNTATAGVANDWSGFLDSLGYNLIKDTTGASIGGPILTGNIFGLDPQVGPLQDNGGPTLTLALSKGSPAIDKGAFVNPELPTDQRGYFRPVDLDSVPNATDGNGSDIGAFELQANEVEFDSVVFDFDGDGATDVSVFRPNGQPTAQWWFLRSSDSGTRGLAFGSSTDVPVAADFTGDGKTDVAFWRPSSGEWFILRSEDDSFFAFPFGSNGDIPAPGDFDGDGKADPAVYRPSSGTWFIVRSSDGGLSVVPFGVAADQPIVADYDGDGKDDVGVYRAPDNQFWLLRSTDGVKAFQFGAPGDRTAVGDWTGDGKADVAFFRPSTSEWYVIRSEDDSFFAFPWGATGDIPSPGDFDGDGKFDPAVWRPGDRTWYIFGTTSGFEAVQFGSPGDVPLPNSVSVN